ncbi:MAG: hypothetical protein ABIR06_19020 [Cyclobacteriaceae bacterium]
MDILMIVVALFSAYVLFVSIAYLLVRVMFPKIDINESEEGVRPVKYRNINRYSPSRELKKQKNLAY